MTKLGRVSTSTDVATTRPTIPALADWRTAFLRQLNPFTRLLMRLVSAEWAQTIVQHVRMSPFGPVIEPSIDYGMRIVERMKYLGRSANYTELARVIRDLSEYPVWVSDSHADKELVDLMHVFLHAVFMYQSYGHHYAMQIDLHDFVCGCGKYKIVRMYSTRRVHYYEPEVNVFNDKCCMSPTVIDAARVGAGLMPCYAGSEPRVDRCSQFIRALWHGNKDLALSMINYNRIYMRLDFCKGLDWIPEILRTGTMWDPKLAPWRPTHIYDCPQEIIEGMIRARRHEDVKRMLTKDMAYNSVAILEAAMDSGDIEIARMVLERLSPKDWHCDIEEAVARRCQEMHRLGDSIYRIATNREPVCRVLSALVDLAVFTKPIVVRLPSIGTRKWFLYDVYMALGRMRLETPKEYFDTPDLQWSNVVLCR